MRIHQAHLVGDATLAKTTPTAPDELVRKDYIDGLLSAPIFITDVTPQSSGIVGLKQYVANTVPAEVIVTDAIADTGAVRVHFLAEGSNTSYNPVVTGRIGSGTEVNAQSMTQRADSPRVFEGYVDLTITADSTVTLTSSTGSTTTVDLVFAADGPESQTVVLGSLPGAQTEAKENDVIAITGTAPNSATSFTVSNAGAAKSGTIGTIGADDSAGAGFRTFSGTIVVSGRSGALGATVVAANALGTNGDPVVSSNTITLNQTYPSISAPAVSYPGAQSALKDTESATVTSTVTNADTVAYTTSADLTVTAANTYAVNKTVTRQSGSYVRNVNNYTITATKASNGAVTTRNGRINIAHVAPTATVSIIGNPGRLRSSAAGEDYVVRISPNQVLDGAPSLVAPAGTWQGSWTQSGNNWQRTLRIVDTDAKGTHTFTGLQLPSLSDRDGSSITTGASYVLGGFTIRDITFTAFAQRAAIGTAISDINKTVARYKGVTPDLTLRNDTNNVAQSYTIVDASGTYDATGDHVFINDVDFAGSNTSGTLIVEIEETA